MPYSTGSGTYSDMMDDVLAHALVDGWTEVGGGGTGWPIETPSNAFFIDYSTDTFSEADNTAGGAGGTLTQRNLRFGASSTSGAGATSNATSGTIVSKSLAYTITAWHIFSEPAVSDHIMVCFEFATAADAKVYGHFGFGWLDQGGLTHGGVFFSGGQIGRAWATDGGTSDDWNDLASMEWAYGGAYGASDNGLSNLDIRIRTTSHPVPSPGPGVGGWPSTGVGYSAGAFVWAVNRPNAVTASPVVYSNGSSVAVNWNIVAVDQQPFSGAVSFMPLPIFIMNGTTSSSTMFYAGAIPNIRLCSMDGFSEGDEVTYGGDTWVLFPVLALKNDSTLLDAYTVTSGRVGYAYKKVS